MKNFFSILLAVVLLSFPLKNSYAEIAVIRALNKVTATSSVLEAKIGERINFGRAVIIAHKCWEAPLEQKPESKMLIEIFEKGNIDDEGQEAVATKGEEKRIFYGWMFASSPSISSLEHPIYDFTALGCK